MCFSSDWRKDFAHLRKEIPPHHGLFEQMHTNNRHIIRMQDKGLFSFTPHRLLFACLLILGTGFHLRAQTPGTENLWKTLAKITYIKEYDAFLGFKIDKPVFSAEIKALQGKEVTVKGFIIPVEGYKSHKEFIFSAFPYANCFFCGGAGPESVMEVSAAEPVTYTAESILLKGKLALNSEDVNKLMFALTDARMVK